MRNQQASSGKRQDVGEVLVTGLSHDGRGLARTQSASVNRAFGHRAGKTARNKEQGKTLFIEGALPGETVTVRILEDRRRFLNSRVQTIILTSDERVEPPCKHFKQCGGCSLQYWSHKGQLAGKQEIVLDQLRRFSSLVPVEVAPPLVSEPYGYRHRARLSIRWPKGGLALGFREKQSKAICSISECPVLSEPLQPLPELLRELLPQLQKHQAISHAELFDADSGRAVLLRHIRPLTEQDAEALRDFARKEQLHLYLQGDPDRVYCLYKPRDDSWLYNQILEFDLTLQFRPNDFTQVNWAINRKMVAQAIEWLQPKPSDRVLDLFCGLGNFSLALARQVQTVTGVEGSEGALERARYNVGLNRIENCDFHQADLSALAKSNEWFNRDYDILLLDPPRTGAIEIIEQMAQALPDRVLYISCNPATLARDAGALAEQGFQLAKLGVMDMFPQTAHVESMGLFIRS